MRGRDDGITALNPVLKRYPRFADLLGNQPDNDLFDRLRAAESIGRPLGDDGFLERSTGRILKPGKRGPKPAESEED